MNQDYLMKWYFLLFIPLFPIQFKNYKDMVKVLFNMYPIEGGIIVFQSIIKVYIFVIGDALTNTIVVQFVQKLKKDWSWPAKKTVCYMNSFHMVSTEIWDTIVDCKKNLID